MRLPASGPKVVRRRTLGCGSSLGCGRSLDPASRTIVLAGVTCLIRCAPVNDQAGRTVIRKRNIARVCLEVAHEGSRAKPADPSSRQRHELEWPGFSGDDESSVILSGARRKG